MRDQPPRRRSHWYNPAVDMEETRPVSSKHGRARERARRRREAHSLPVFSWTWLVIGGAIIGVIAVISLIVLSGNNSGPATPLPTATRVFSTGNGPATIIPMPVIQAWDGKQRFTVLVMGIDKRPGESGTGFRTDTMILLSIDPSTKSIGMLSIPRDLYVPIPGQSDMQRINFAYVLGELDRPGGGPILAMQTVQYNFGIPVSHYVVVSFEAVIGLVDAIGGIDLDVPQAIDDPEYPDMNYGFDPLRIPAGLVHMNGQLALKYARTRHQGTDYDRANRQQQVILAIRKKVLKPDLLPQLVGQAPAIWSTVSKGLITDLTLDQALSIGWYLKDIPADSIHRATLEDKYIQAVQYNGDSVMTPNRNLLSQLMSQVFGPNYSR